MNPDGISPAYLARVAQIESGGNPAAKAKSSTATGLFQFVDGTWMGLLRQYPKLRLTPGGRTDPAQSERAMRQFTADNAKIFVALVKREPTPSESYLSHFLGVTVATKIVLADPLGPCAPVVGAAVIRANPFIKGMSCGALREWSRKKVPDDLSLAAAMPGAPPRGLDHEDLNARELTRVRGNGDTP
jgi:hypothetical protein